MTIVFLQNHRRWSNVLYLPPLKKRLSTSIFLYLLNMRNLNYLHVYIIAVQSVIIPCERIITTEGIDTFVTTCQQMASTFDHYYPHGGLDIILLFHIAFYFVYGVSEDGEVYLLWLLGSVEVFILWIPFCLRRYTGLPSWACCRGGGHRGCTIYHLSFFLYHLA